jgi:Rhodopirellula transposase DDE domain
MPLTLEVEQHPDHDAQFQYINEQVKARQDTAEPVISVDAKKKKKKKQLGQAQNAHWKPLVSATAWMAPCCSRVLAWVAAIVDAIAMPIAPPSCWEVLMSPDRPASASADKAGSSIFPTYADEDGA